MTNVETYIADISEEARESGLSEKVWQSLQSIPSFDDDELEGPTYTLEDYDVMLEQTVDMTQGATRSMISLCLYLKEVPEVPYELREEAEAAGMQIIESEIMEWRTAYGLRVFFTQVSLEKKMLQYGGIELSDEDIHLIEEGLKKLKVKE